MKLLHPDDSLIPILKRMIGDGLKYWIFSVDIPIDLDTTLADVTAAATFGPVEVEAADFDEDTVSNHKGTTVAEKITLTNNTGNLVTCRGYFITNVGEDTLIGVAKFDSPKDVPMLGTIDLYPILGDQSQYS